MSDEQLSKLKELLRNEIPLRPCRVQLTHDSADVK